jgi:pyruvate formate lyase activating enzyme
VSRTALISNIQRFSLHDGRGIRTIVFLKGCPARCRWCSNPETQRPGRELGFDPGRCLGSEACGRCLEACPRGLVALGGGGRLLFDRSRCDCCLSCADACPAGARFAYGEPMAAEDVLDQVEGDGVFFRRSGGGLTLSGGEALLQPDFALELLRGALRRRIDTALETSGLVPWEALRDAAGLLGRILYDLKHWDEARHVEEVGLSNLPAIENLRRLAEEFPQTPVTVRTPVIPGFNDTEKDLAAIRRLIPIFPNMDHELLPFHRLGLSKYAFLGRAYAYGEAALPAGRFEALQRLAAG